MPPKIKHQYKFKKQPFFFPNLPEFFSNYEYIHCCTWGGSICCVWKEFRRKRVGNFSDWLVENEISNLKSLSKKINQDIRRIFVSFLKTKV